MNVDAPVRIDYTKNGQKISKRYDLMVVACDPRNLNGICDYDETEKGLFEKLINFTFHTSLLKVKRTKELQHGVIFAPDPLETMEGKVYGFRNESAKTFQLSNANMMDENLVTVYQLLGPESDPLSPKEFEAILRKELAELYWWPFGDDYEILQSLTTPYFDHFLQKDLAYLAPWTWLDIQGKNRTFYVHASTCFESALDCWGYENMILDPSSPSGQRLPADKSAAIAIIGAGVSGLLMAVKLKDLGYNNIEILEKTDRYGGKTHTVEENGPFPPGIVAPTYCELGTCYLSPSYDAMVKDLAEYTVGNEQIDFGNYIKRGIAIPKNVQDYFHLPPEVMDSDEYTLRVAELQLGLHHNALDDIEAQIALLEELVKYLFIHEKIFGNAFPMPGKPVDEFLHLPYAAKFSKFLNHYGLNGLIGLLQYGYEVQGYGVLDKIPAYYGLVWINPPIIEAILENSLISAIDALGGAVVKLLGLIEKFIPDPAVKNYLQKLIERIEAGEKKQIPIVTSWSEGWGDMWDQVVQKQELSEVMELEVSIDSIRRLG
ncbi:MAG: NAD(P)-binding protein [Bacteroidota bacterium]